jgi:hypothetical protein
VLSTPGVAAGDELALAVGADGTAVVAWTEAAGPARLRVAVRPPRGGFGAPVTLTDGAASGPAAAVGADGSAIVAWSEAGGARFARRPAGGAFGAPGSVAPAGEQASVAVAHDAQGGSVLAWVRDGTRVQAAVAPPGGGFEAAEDVSAPAGARVFAPRVAVRPTGRALVVWERADDDLHTGSRVQLAARAPGGPFGAVETVGSAPAGDARVAFVRDGRALVLWHERIGTHEHVADAEWTADAGIVVGHRLASAESVRGLTLAGHPDGDLVASWLADGRVQAVRRRPKRLWEAVRTLAEPAGGPAPGAAVDGRGNAVVAWGEPAAGLRASAYDGEGPRLQSVACSGSASRGCSPRASSTSGRRSPSSGPSATRSS